MGISTFNPYVRVFVVQVKGRGVLVLVCLLLQLNFLPFPIILFISLLPAAFNCHHLPFLLEGVLSYPISCQDIPVLFKICDTSLFE